MKNDVPEKEPYPLILRGYVQPKSLPAYKWKRLDEPSEWALIFDTETSTDAAQHLRFGTYQVRQSETLREEGIFYDELALTAGEIDTLRSYSEAQSLVLHTHEEFIEKVFYGVGYDLGAAIIGFNLPFDISRISTYHSAARTRSMRGGFSFRPSLNERKSRLQVKHLSQRASLIRFASPMRQNTPRGMRKNKSYVAPSRGFFYDVKTLAAALTSQSWSLEGLSKALKVAHPKLAIEEHGGLLTAEYLDYAVRDTQTTWECFVELRDRYKRHNLFTPTHHIYSEASLGKAYLKEMGIKSWRELQPDFPPSLIGSIMSSYYGGRSEIHIRREIAEVRYCDFQSMYPTVCSLMGLWRFVISNGMKYREETAKVQKFLDSVTLADLQKPETWPKLCVLVQIKPRADIFPVRAPYDGTHLNIGLNYLTSENALWYTLADCIASKLLTGKAPKILRAISFSPDSLQAELKPVSIAGKHDYQIDPAKDDFYRRTVDLRIEVKAKQKAAQAELKEQLETEQLFLKILTNATSYGAFVELNVEELSKTKVVTCIQQNGKGFPVSVDKTETPGTYFHPLLATLITGAARLMLAMAERLIVDNGLNWAFCDTDSMAIAKPDGLSDLAFEKKSRAVQSWFSSLNPYAIKKDLFKFEDANFDSSGRLQKLYCLALSAKRYVLFNLGSQRQTIIRKASAHGLGHLLSPYKIRPDNPVVPLPSAADLKKIGLKLWQYDMWHRVISETLAGNPTHYNPAGLPGFDRPAVSRYAATTPALLDWFKPYNAKKTYREQVRPFGFMLSFHALDGIPLQLAGHEENAFHAVAPYDKDSSKAAAQCFDRITGKPIPLEYLKTYRQTLAQYHLSPENKFLNGEHSSRGVLKRRHVYVSEIRYIGKEANRWEEQFYTGLNPEAQIDYGSGPENKERLFKRICEAVKSYGKTRLAYTADISAKHLAAVIERTTEPSANILAKLERAILVLEKENQERLKENQTLLSWAKRQCIENGLRSFAEKIEFDAGNLSKILLGKRRISKELLYKLNRAI